MTLPSLRPAFAFAVLALIASACTGSDDAASYAVRDSAGVQIVTNGEHGAWKPGQAWQLREDLRITASDTIPHHDFSDISSVGVTSNGNILLLDMAQHQLNEFDSTGAWVQTVARPGQGPGEFGVGPQFMTMGADSGFVFDFGNQRLTVFAPDGHLARSFPISFGGTTPGKWDFLPGKGLIEQVKTIILPGQTDVKPVNQLVTVDSNGAASDTLLQLPLGQILDMSAGPASVKTHLLAPDVSWDAAPDGRILAAVTDTYRVSVYDHGGKLEQIISRESPTVAVSPAEREAVLTGYRDAMMQSVSKLANSQAAAIIKRMVDNVDVAPVYPAFAALVAGPDSTILVHRTATVKELQKKNTRLTLDALRGQSPRWDVFDAAGRYLGVLEFPEGFRLAAVTSDHFYGVTEDSLDLPSLVRLKVVR